MQFRQHTPFPPEVLSLVKAHHLGQLRKKHSEQFIRGLQVVLGSIFLLIAFFSMIGGIYPSFGSPISLGHPLFFSTLGILLSLSIIFLVATRRSNYVAYEYSNGFLLLWQGNVEFVLTWDRLVGVRKERGTRGPCYFIMYLPTKQEEDRAVDKYMKEMDEMAKFMAEYVNKRKMSLKSVEFEVVQKEFQEFEAMQKELQEFEAVHRELKELAQGDEKQRETLRMKLAKQIVADNGTMDYQLFSASLWKRCRLELSQRQREQKNLSS